MARCWWGRCRAWLRSVPRKAGLRFQQEWGVGDQGGGKVCSKDKAGSTREVAPGGKVCRAGASVQGGDKPRPYYRRLRFSCYWGCYSDSSPRLLVEPEEYCSFISSRQVSYFFCMHRQALFAILLFFEK